MKGIKFFENQYQNKRKEGLGKKRKVKELSSAFMKSMGLADKKGKQLYYPEPVGKWRKRKETVENKLKK